MSPALLLSRLAFDGATRGRTWKKLAAQAGHGMALYDSVRTLGDQAAERRSPLVAVFGDVLTRLGGGHNLGTALTGYASPEEILLISSGQKAGRLGDGLLLAAELLENRRKIVGAVIGALAYPLFLFLLSLVMLAIVSLYVMPQLVELADPQRWTGFAALLYAASSFAGSWAGAVAAVVFAGGCVVMIVTLPLWTGRLRRTADRFPPWSMYRLTVGGVWLFTLATLMRSGMQQTQILHMMIESDTTTPYLRQRVRAISDQSAGGKNLGEAMYDCGMGFPDPALIDDFRVYAKLPGFHDRLYDIARDWMQEGIESIRRNARLLNVLFLLAIIGQMGLLALSVMDLQSQLTTQTTGGF